MRAFLYLIAMPEPGEIDGLDEDGGRELRQVCMIGTAPDVDLVVRKLAIGGRKNSIIVEVEDDWRLCHTGHAVPIFLNGQPISHQPSLLHDGDVIRPAVVGGSAESGPAFVFVEAGEGTLRRDILPVVSRSLSASDRARELEAEVRRWLSAEVQPSRIALARIPHCLLCGRFRARDRLAGFSASSIWLCADCRRDPAATFERAAEAPTLLAEIDSALEAKTRAALERRFAAAVPLRTSGRCTLCSGERDVLARAGQAVCLACLERARLEV